MFVLVKRFGEHVVTVVVESRGLESHENRLIQSHPSDVGVGRRLQRRTSSTSWPREPVSMALG